MSCVLLERWALMLNKVNILNNEVMFNLGLCMMTSLKADHQSGTEAPPSYYSNFLFMRVSQ